jgi:hypothetical protein
VALTIRQESSGKIEIKKLNVECDIDENFKVDQGFYTVFPAIMFLFELRGKSFKQNALFHQY